MKALHFFDWIHDTFERFGWHCPLCRLAKCIAKKEGDK